MMTFPVRSGISFAGLKVLDADVPIPVRKVGLRSSAVSLERRGAQNDKLTHSLLFERKSGLCLGDTLGHSSSRKWQGCTVHGIRSRTGASLFHTDKFLQYSICFRANTQQLHMKHWSGVFAFIISSTPPRLASIQCLSFVARSKFWILRQDLCYIEFKLARRHPLWLDITPEGFVLFAFWSTLSLLIGYTFRLRSDMTREVMDPVSYSNSWPCIVLTIEFAILTLMFHATHKLSNLWCNVAARSTYFNSLHFFFCRPL